MSDDDRRTIVDDFIERQKYALKETIDFVREHNPDLDDDAIRDLIDKYIADEMTRVAETAELAKTLRLEVASGCGGCPLEDSNDGRPYCNADPTLRCTEPNYGETWPSGSPSWCPLDKGPVTVELKRVDETGRSG